MGLVGFTPPPAARKPRKQAEQTIAPSSTDAFSTPDAPSPESPQPLLGDEPAIFGGLNPPPSSQAPLPPDPTAVPTADVVPEEFEGDEALGPGRGSWRPILVHAIRSSRLLAIAFVVSTVIATWGILQWMPAEAYVHTVARLRPIPDPTAAEAERFRGEVNAVVRSYPVRAAAMKMLETASPEVPPGFLKSALSFSGGGSIQWLDDHSLRLRVNSTTPKEDSIRLAYAAAGLMQVLNDRAPLLAEQKQKVANLQLHLKTLQEEKKQLAEEDRAHPTSAEGTDATIRNTLDERIAATETEIQTEQRIVDLWPLPAGVDQAGVQAVDNRPVRTTTIMLTWAGLALLFGGTIVLNQWRRYREAETKRRARRELLAKQPAERAGDVPRDQPHR